MMNLTFLFSIFVLLLIGDITADPPVIQNANGNANLDETQNVDKCVYQLDTLPLAFSCAQTSAHAQFALQKRAGDADYCVYYLASPGSLAPPSYTVDFTCDDGAGNDTSSFVKIDIIPNAPPTFDKGSTVVEFADASATSVSQTLFSVAVTDDNGDILLFSLDNTYAEFDINPSTGEVYAKVDFNTLTAPSFSFKIRVTDNHSLVVEQDVTLNLNNINTPPQITNLVDPLTYPEDVAPNVDLYQCTHDETGALTKSFAVVPASETLTFSFDATTCKIRLDTGKKLDFETVPTMNMTITLNDGVYSRDFPFTFNVLNVNEPPTFASNSYTMDIFELPVPALPAIQPTFVVSDEDAADTSTFSLGTGSYEPYFTIDGTTGALTCIKELDYDAGITQVTVTVIVTDSGGESASTTLIVNVADYNDNDPEFSTSTTLYISPKTPVGKIGEVVGTDKDTGVNAMLTYSKVSDSSGGKFQVQPDGSVFLLVPVTEADRNNIYSVVARATDGGGPSKSGKTTVTILFNPPPVITNMPNVAFISEDTTVKKEMFKIEVTDDDTFVCVADKVTPTTANVAFVVEKKTGGTDWFVFYTGLEPLSFDTQPTFLVDVICTDSHDGKSIKSTLTINVRKNQPPFLDCIQTVGVDASSTTNGDTVYTVTATDDDTLTYQMTLLPSSGTFIIGTGGEIICQKQMIRETISQYTSTITVSDTFNSVSCTVTLTMTNTNAAPEFFDLPKFVTVDEDLAGGSLISEVTINDAQECDPTTFTWDVDQTADRIKFTATMTANVVSLSLAAGQELDHETFDDYVFYFRANDGCLDSQLYPLYVSVADINEPPEFLNGMVYTAIFNEVNSPDVDLGCNGFDPDVWDSHTLTLTGFNFANNFAITDPSRCIIKQVVEHDRDGGLAANFKLTITMTDKAGLSATATVNVVVNEINDNDPICNQPAFTFADIFNGDTIGRQLGSVRATDADKAGSINSQLTYTIVAPSSGTSIVACTSDGTFRIIADPESQLLAAGTLLDFTVQVTDNGNPARSTTCKANVQYIYTTTPPPPPTQPQTMPPAATMAGGGGANEGSGAGASTATTAMSPLSSVDEALSNPVILGLIAGLGALAALGAIAGLVFCCRKCGACKGGNTGNYDTTKKNYDFNKDRASRLQSRGSLNGSPKTNQVGNTTTTDIYTTNKVNPNVNDTPTTLKFL